MSKELSSFKFVLDQSEVELEEFGRLLDSKAELSEKNDLLPFFRERPNLAAFAASCNVNIDEIDLLEFELDLFGNFRCDWVAGQSRTGEFALVEMEDATRYSIFGPGPKYHDEWGSRFEHGFSQLVDWFWTLDDHRTNADLRKRFGNRLHRFSALLLIGRSQFLDEAMRERLHWRVNRVSINSCRVTCMTFDDLRETMEARIKNLRDLAN